MQSVTARFIPYARLSGRENMAIDEYLLSYHEKTGAPVFRVYGWNRPTITIGRYQQTGCLNWEACNQDNVDIVRRITGGGALYHDNEVTYSLVCSGIGPGGGALSIRQSFEKINGMIIGMYAKLGLAARYAGATPGPGRPGKISQFCFSGREEYDILIDEKKIGGNAQRRTKGAVFQHGSVPLGINPDGVQKYFLEKINCANFISLGDALGRDVSPADVIEKLADSFTQTFTVDLINDDIHSDETAYITGIIREKYDRIRWNLDAHSGEYDGTPAEAAQ